MDFGLFEELVGRKPDGVVLLEGRRNIADEDARAATRLARGLAERFPLLRFRSGNATGADEAFSEGVASVGPTRLQVVTPYSSHRKASRIEHAVYDSPEGLPTYLRDAAERQTVSSSPANRRLIERSGGKGALAAKASYLTRDTLKVTGHSDEFVRPVCALFYVDLADPMAGGTGHTIRVCRDTGVRYGFQDAWGSWVD